MFKIYICEDDQMQRQRMDDILSEIINTENQNIQKGYITGNPYEMLEAVKDEKNTGLFFIDIDLGGDINGLELAKEIRKIQPRCYIVFVTTHSEMSFLTFSYKVEALDFILKDNPEELKSRVHQCLIMALNRSENESVNENKILTLKIGEHVRVFLQDEIKFFEVSPENRRIIIHGVDTIMEFPGKLKDIEKCVDERFVRCHRGFIVNKDYVERVDVGERIIYIEGGESCPMSVRLGKKLNLS